MTTRGIYTLSKGCDPVRAEFSFNGANPSYVKLCFVLSGRRDSNSQQPAWKAGALPIELLPQIKD